jgi:hypothetical protein
LSRGSSGRVAIVARGHDPRSSLRAPARVRCTRRVRPRMLRRWSASRLPRPPCRPRGVRRRRRSRWSSRAGSSRFPGAPCHTSGFFVLPGISGLLLPIGLTPRWKAKDSPVTLDEAKNGHPRVREHCRGSLARS